MKLRLCVVTVILAIGCHFSIFGYSTGITGRTAPGVGCQSCHGTTPGATQISAQSGSGTWTVQVNSTLNITLIVSHSSRPRAGVNIAVKTTQNGNTDAGNLQPVSGSGLQKIGSELTHTGPKPLSGGQVSFEFTWQAPSTPGTYYLRAAANAVNYNGQSDPNDEWNVMTPIAITVTAPSKTITVNTPNGGEQWCVGSMETIEWTATGVDSVDILLSADAGQSYSVIASGLLASTGSWDWNIPPDLNPGANYRIKIRDHSDHNVADESNGNFSLYGNTRIVSQSQSQEVCLGSNVTLQVQAEGGALSYQWRKNGQPLPGQTSSELRLSNFQLSDTGTYDVVVSGLCGPAVTSDPIHLGILLPPQIVQEPESLSLCVGDTAVFSVSAVGEGLSYQWYKDGNVIRGATDSIYVVPAVTEDDAGIYQVIVTGRCSPAAISQEAALTVIQPPAIVQQPGDTIVTEGATVTLRVVATGDSLRYQWRKDGQSIPGATAAELVLAAVQLQDSGMYDCQVSNLCGAVLTRKAKVKILPAGPGAIISLSSSSVDFGVVLVGTEKLDSVRILNTGTDTLRITAVNIEGLHPSLFAVEPSSNLTIAPNASVFLSIWYRPQGRGEHRAEMTFESNAVNQPVITLHGRGGIYFAEVSTPIVEFPNTPVGTSTDTAFEVRNTGDFPLTLTEVRIGGQDSEAFQVVNLQLPQILQPNESMSINIQFTPSEANRLYSAECSVIFSEEAQLDPLRVELRGNSTVASVASFESTLVFYPNPSSEYLHIQSSEPIKQISLFTVHGQLLGNRVFPLPVFQYTFEWESFLQKKPEAGLYQLQLQTVSGRVIQQSIIIVP